MNGTKKLDTPSTIGLCSRPRICLSSSRVAGQDQRDRQSGGQYDNGFPQGIVTPVIREHGSDDVRRTCVWIRSFNVQIHDARPRWRCNRSRIGQIAVRIDQQSKEKSQDHTGQPVQSSDLLSIKKSATRNNTPVTPAPSVASVNATSIAPIETNNTAMTKL